MNESDREWMELAVAAARKCRGEPRDPLVGAVAVLNGELLGTAFRGEKQKGEHAEYTLLEKHLPSRSVAGATVYTTLEPCTSRNLPKIPCVQRLLDRRVSRVVIGMLDPNPLVSGLSYRMLRQANVVTELFPQDLMAQVEELNRDFIRSIESDIIHQTSQEIATLAKRTGTPQQQEAIGASLRNCLHSLREINKGQIHIPGREAGYFKRFLERLEDSQGTQHIRAFIRLTAFDPCELLRNSWFDNFYRKLDAACCASKLVIDYIFLIRTNSPVDEVAAFIDGYKYFAQSIKTVCQHDARLAPEILRPSIVLWEDQSIAFTHDRGDNSSLIEATEWIKSEDFHRLRDQYGRIEVMSTPYYAKSSGPAVLLNTLS